MMETKNISWWNKISNELYCIDDCISGMKKIPDGVVDFILTDPPYGLAGGYVCRSGKGEVFAEDWDSEDDMKDITVDWLTEAKRILKENGTIMVSGTHHNYPIVAYYMKQLGFYIINDIIWIKPNPPPLMHRSKFCPATETIIFARKGKKHYFNYEKSISLYKKMRDDCSYGRDSSEVQAKNVLYYSATDDDGKRLHPTQKPTRLWEHLLLVATKPGDIVLDPFLGSGSTIKVCRQHNRIGYGFELNPEYENIIRDRSIDTVEENKINIGGLW
jgi:DNA modification methylase